MTQALTLNVDKIIHETEEAITLILKDASGKEIKYQAGQFLTLLINLSGKELRRSYSICSTPGFDNYLAITVKRIVNGEVSRYLIDHVKEGDSLKSLPPTGRFLLETDGDAKRDIFLIGAGSGITPLYSILKSVLHYEPLSKITLVDVNRNEKTAFYWLHLNQLKERFATKLEVFHFLSEPGPELKHLQRRLNIGVLEELVKRTLKFKKEESKFFVCGPFEFMRMVRMTLIYMGFNEGQITEKAFCRILSLLNHHLHHFPKPM